MGIKEGKAKGYDMAIEDLKPIMSPEMQKNIEKRGID